MLTEETIIDRVELDEPRNVYVRRATYVLRDGVRIPGPRYHRNTYTPHSALDHEDVLVQRLAAAAWLDVPKPVPQELPIP